MSPAKSGKRQRDTGGRVREAAVKSYLTIESGNVFIQDVLSKAFNKYHLDSRDKRYLHELLTGAVKMRGRLEYIIDKFLKADISRWTRACLILGLYQMVFSSGTPDYAAVNEFVALAARHENPGAASVVNAILRRYQRESASIEYPDPGKDPVGHLQHYHSLPRWLCEDWVRRFGYANALKLAQWANSRQPPSVKLYGTASDLPPSTGFENHPVFPDYYYYTGKGDPRQSEPYRKAKIYFQDPAAGLAAKISEAKPGDTVFDIGAAPGGKSINLFESIKGDGQLIAIESNKGKISGLKKNLYRMGMDTVNIVNADINGYETDTRADVVLLDVPCSGLGTISRNADLRWRVKPQQIADYADQQLKMLRSSSKLVKSGGVLIYSTCTMTEEENRDTVNKFLNENRNFERDPIYGGRFNLSPESITATGDLFILPYHYETDGAFVSRMRRKE